MSKRTSNKRILLTGGGTGGSVSPLLAVAKELRDERSGYDLLWVGTKKGVEEKMVKKEGIEFFSVPAGKLRRYFDLRNFIDPFKIGAGFVCSLVLMLKRRPDLIISAGSFVSVPVVWSGWLLRVPALIHQQDVRPGLANKLMAPFARRITVTFQKSLDDYGKKAIWTGNPAAEPSSDGGEGGLPEFTDARPVVLVVGGGTGARALNRLTRKNISELTRFCTVIHITGGKEEGEDVYSGKEQGYFKYQFLERSLMLKAIQRSDIVVSRAGLGLLTEISYFAKPCVLIPMPDSHQEDNARLFEENGAAIVLNQREISTTEFTDRLKRLLNDKRLLDQLSRNAAKMMRRDGSKRVVRAVKEIISDNTPQSG